MSYPNYNPLITNLLSPLPLQEGSLSQHPHLVCLRSQGCCIVHTLEPFFPAKKRKDPGPNDELGVEVTPGASFCTIFQDEPCAAKTVEVTPGVLAYCETTTVRCYDTYTYHSYCLVGYIFQARLPQFPNVRQAQRRSLHGRSPHFSRRLGELSSPCTHLQVGNPEPKPKALNLKTLSSEPTYRSQLVESRATVKFSSQTWI